MVAKFIGLQVTYYRSRDNKRFEVQLVKFLWLAGAIQVLLHFKHFYDPLICIISDLELFTFLSEIGDLLHNTVKLCN